MWPSYVFWQTQAKHIFKDPPAVASYTLHPGQMLDRY